MFLLILTEYFMLIFLTIIIVLQYKVNIKLKNKNQKQNKEINKITNSFDSLTDIFKESINLLAIFYFDDFELNLMLYSQKWIDCYGDINELKKNHTTFYLKLLKFQKEILNFEEQKNIYVLKDEFILKHKTMKLKMYISPWMNENKIVGILVEGINITEYESSEKKKALNNINATILSITAHQLKNRIRKVYLTLEDKTVYTQLTPCGNCNIKTVIKNLDNLVDDLISLGGIYQTVKISKSEKVNVKLYINNIIKLSNFKKEEVVIDIEEEKTIEIENKILLENVILEILLNSWKYRNNKKEIKIEIKIDIKNETNYIIKIKDNGIGVKEKELDYIQNPYFRGTPIKPEIEGTGLGLVFCKLALDAIEMTFNISSKYLEYTEVTMVRKNG